MRSCLLAVTVLLIIAAHARAQPVAQKQDPNRRCLECHGQSQIGELGPAERLTMVGKWTAPEPRPPTETAALTPSLSGNEPPKRPGLYITADCLVGSVHANVTCVECHEDAKRLPHNPTLNRATCATSCHDRPAREYAGGAHKAALDRGVKDVPTCASCHGGHDIRPLKERRPQVERIRALYMCGDCHKTHAADEQGVTGAQRVGNYLASVHGRAVQGSGLVWSATCADCHGSHGVRSSNDPESRVHRLNVASTCGQCHTGVEAVFSRSVHAKKLEESDGKTAVCTDCHSGHAITRAGDSPEFVRDVIEECGHCHDNTNNGRKGSYYKTYHNSYHGQVTMLGGRRAARCSDCHGFHDILPTTDAGSRVHNDNLIATCSKCHPGASTSFVRYDPHANHRDRKNYPLLHAVWLYFMVMMSSVFTFFGLHTLLWFIRSTIERRKLKANGKHPHAPTAIRRFTLLDRINHAFVALTFFGLTGTGIPLVFADQHWAKTLAAVFGGIEAAGLWHRFFAVLLIANFALHFVGLGRAFLKRTCSWRDWLFGPNALLPRWKDVKDCLGMFRWFFGRGPRPSFDRWTYWEKFDYWAEVGGSMIIGGSGLLLWFPVLAAKIFPGWMFNVAMVVHGYEALLAIGFIFTIHFFNAHVRPGVFPVDEVIFTGSMPEHELKEQRPEEYKRLVATGRLEALRVPAPHPRRRRVNLVIALVSVGVGVVLLAFIILGGLKSL